MVVVVVAISMVLPLLGPLPAHAGCRVHQLQAVHLYGTQEIHVTASASCDQRPWPGVRALRISIDGQPWAEVRGRPEFTRIWEAPTPGLYSIRAEVAEEGAADGAWAAAETVLVQVHAAPTPTPTATPAPPVPFVPYDEVRPILAYHYGMRAGDAIFRRPDIVREQIRQAKAAGIDGFIVWWEDVGTDRDRQLLQVLEIGAPADFRATIHLHLFNDNPADVEGQLRRFYEQRLNLPGLVTYQGRPVLFFWEAGRLPNATWSELRARVDPERRALWIADGDRFDILLGDAWDGISPYAIAWSNDPIYQLQSWAAKARLAAPDKLYIPPVSPGCDLPPGRVPDARDPCVQDRADGAYYLATLEGAMASGPPWGVVVSTWDELYEGTGIEPTRAWGDLYLELTRQFALAFKGGQAFQPIEPEATPDPVPTEEAPVSS